VRLLACVTRHSPVLLTSEECAEECAEDDAGRMACPGCSLAYGDEAGDRAGMFRPECTVLAPCGVLLAMAAHYGVPVPAGDGAARITAERRRQLVEGYDAGHDARHPAGELTYAAIAYAAHAAARLKHRGEPAAPYAGLPARPWPRGEFRPGPDALTALVRAGGLIAAEIDRIEPPGAVTRG
jgi:hypothetical protein